MKLKEQKEAKRLRKRGHSLTEIARISGVGKSSVSLWVRDTALSSKAQKRIHDKLTAGQRIAQQSHREQTEKKVSQASTWAEEFCEGVNIDKDIKILLATMAYWCEGTKKTGHGVEITNSDPQLISMFLRFLRAGFQLDESRFRAVLHLHEYHDANTQIDFWSSVTSLPRRQFLKPYKKPRTGRTYREKYPGCIQIRYYDTNMARKLQALAAEVMKK